MARLKFTKREVWMLHFLLDFPIIRYMMCNAKGRADGGEKATVHIEISQCLSMFFLCEGVPRHEETPNVRNATMPVHDYLAHILTDRMDEVIGYPFDKQMYGEDFQYFADEFFKVILDHTAEIKKVVFDNKED